MLKGRLGLDTARLPHADRHGLLWLDRGNLSVEDGCLRFVAAGSDTVPKGDYRVPHQAISLILLGPGSTVSHDALRLLARHNTGLAAIGEGGVRFYTAQPLLPDHSALGRAQARAWADEKGARMACGPAHVRLAPGRGPAAPGHRRAAWDRGRPREGGLPPDRRAHGPALGWPSL